MNLEQILLLLIERNGEMIIFLSGRLPLYIIKF